jgi:peroxiredoxin
MPIETGHAVPDFTLPRDGGGQTGPADYRGKKLVLYFYPKDDTPGCTVEALASPPPPPTSRPPTPSSSASPRTA